MQYNAAVDRATTHALRGSAESSRRLHRYRTEGSPDVHGHIYLNSHLAARTPDEITPSMPEVVVDYPREAFADVQKRLWPGRTVGALVFGTVGPRDDIEAMNAYVGESARICGWEALMVPEMTDDNDTILAKVRAGGFLGLKPYWTFVTWKHQNDVTLEDMVTPAMREAADRGRLLVMVHIPRPGRLADPVNIAGMRKLCSDAPNATIVLAHFGRAYFPEAIGDGLALAAIDNLHVDLSMVQHSEVIEAALRAFGSRRVMFGLDLPVAQEKGKLISVNGQRHFFTKRAHSWSVHAEPGSYEVRCTLFAYEMVRAIQRAATNLGLTDSEIEDVFHNNAHRLTHSICARKADTDRL